MTNAIPEGFHTLTPHIIVQDAVAAIEFYQKAFGAQELVRHMTPDGKLVIHAQLQIGDSILMLANEWPPACYSPKSRGGTSTILHLYVNNADVVYDRAVHAGCTVKAPLREQFWGDLYGVVVDPFGHEWSIASHLHDYTPEELAERTKAAFANR